MNIPEQIQVGFQSNYAKDMVLDTSVEEFPLAYARRWGTGSAEKKLTESMEKWCKRSRREWKYVDGKQVPTGLGEYGQFKPIILDNTPVKGFKFGSSVSRWSTSNKWFEVYDPRGFKLQISASNLAMLIGDSEIKRGEILTECVWAFTSQCPVLLDVNSEYYKEQVKKIEDKEERESALVKVGARALEVGGIYQKKDGDLYMFLGRLDIEGVLEGSALYRYGDPQKEEFKASNLFLLGKL